MTLEINKYDFVGYFAALSLCGVLIPQLYHNYKEKKMDQISWVFIFLSNVTSILFLVYGILIYSIPIIIANTILIIQNFLLIILKLRYTTDYLNKYLQNM